MNELALLKKIGVLLGPWDGPADYAIVEGYLIDDRHAIYTFEGVINLTRADRLKDDLYTEAAASNIVRIGYDTDREPVAAIAEIVGRLRNVTALDWLMGDVLSMRGAFDFYGANEY